MSTDTFVRTGTSFLSRRGPLARQAEAGERRPVADSYELADSLVRAESRRRWRAERGTEVIQDRQRGLRANEARRKGRPWCAGLAQLGYRVGDAARVAQ